MPKYFNENAKSTAVIWVLGLAMTTSTDPEKPLGAVVRLCLFPSFMAFFSSLVRTFRAKRNEKTRVRSFWDRGWTPHHPGRTCSSLLLPRIQPGDTYANAVSFFLSAFTSAFSNWKKIRDQADFSCNLLSPILNNVCSFEIFIASFFCFLTLFLLPPFVERCHCRVCFIFRACSAFVTASMHLVVFSHASTITLSFSPPFISSVPPFTVGKRSEVTAPAKSEPQSSSVSGPHLLFWILTLVGPLR